MHDSLKGLLHKHGLSANADNNQATDYYNGLSDEDKSKVNDAFCKLMGFTEDGGDEGEEGDLSEKELPTDQTSAKVAASAKLPARTQIVDEDELEVAALAKRVKTIKSLASIVGVNADEFVASTATVKEIKAAMLAKVSENKPVVGASIRVGQSAAQQLIQDIPVAMLARSAAMCPDEKARTEFYKKMGVEGRNIDQLRQHKATNMYRIYLAELGIPNATLLSDNAIVDAMGPRGFRRVLGSRVAALSESVSDFSNIVLDAQNKTLRALYLDEPKSWNIWAAKNFAPDFKNVNRVALGEVPSMSSRLAGAELKYVTMTDSKEVYTLTEYALGLRLTRRAIINDDMNAFANIPRLQAQAAARLEDDTAYAVLTGNSNMADGNPIMGTAHANLVGSGSGGAPTGISQIQTTATLIETQTGLAGSAVLNLAPKFILVPTALKYATQGFLGSERLVASQSTSAAVATLSGDYNPFNGKFVVVADQRLNVNSTSKWYMMTDYRDNKVSTVEVCFLQDEPEPVLKQESEWDTDDVKYLIRHTVAAKALDFRGIAQNFGS